MTSINRPVQDEPAEGGDIPDAGPGAEHGTEHPLTDDVSPNADDSTDDVSTNGDDDSGPLLGNTPDEEADGPLRPGKEQPDGMSG